MTDYLKLDAEQESSTVTTRTRSSKFVIPSAIGLGVAAMLCFVARAPPNHSQADGRAFLVSRNGEERKDHVCNCPPSYALWACSKEEHDVLLSGKSCEFYERSIQLSRKMCTCPPSDAIWECSEDEYKALLNATSCTHYNGTQSSVRTSALLSAERSITDAADHKCNCPPSYAIWDCPRSEYDALVTGSTCEYYKHAKLAMGYAVTQYSPTVLAGGDVDEHGCVASAGYSWCLDRSSCIRPWEHDIHSAGDLSAFCSQTAKGALPLELAGHDRDSHGCYPSAGYVWCAARSSCIRPWEHNLHSPQEIKAVCSSQQTATTQTLAAAVYGGDRDSHGCYHSAGYAWCAVSSSCIRPWEHSCQN